MRFIDRRLDQRTFEQTHELMLPEIKVPYIQGSYQQDLLLHVNRFLLKRILRPHVGILLEVKTGTYSKIGRADFCLSTI